MDDQEIKIAAENIGELALDLRRAKVRLETDRSGKLARKILERVYAQIPGVLMRIDDEESL